MDSRYALLADQLLLIERELRRLGWWAETAPSAEALASVEPFCVDTLSFDQWLQFVLIPRMEQLVVQQAPLPTSVSSSSPPRPKMKGSPPFSRTTRSPRCCARTCAT